MLVLKPCGDPRKQPVGPRTAVSYISHLYSRHFKSRLYFRTDPGYQVSHVITAYIVAGRPGGVSGYPRACGIGQFREFEPRRVHTRIISLGLFLVHKLTCGKRESVS